MLQFTLSDKSLVESMPQAEKITLLGIDLALRPHWFHFLGLCAAVFILYITYGFIQELLFEMDGMQPYGWHLTLIQFLIYSLAASLKSHCNKSTSRRIPFSIYLQIAALTVGTVGFSNAAVGYLNYPTQVIFKCCKLIPVLIGGIIIQGKKYSWVELLAACMMSLGLAIFILADSKVSPMFSSLGYAMVSTALLFDAVIGNVQEKSLHTFQATNDEMVLYSYSLGAIYILIGLIIHGNFLDGFYFFAEHPVQTYGYGILFSLVGFLGVNAVLSLVRTYGALIAATVTTVRKTITIILSFLFFSKPFTMQYIWGGILILLAIYLNLYAKSRPGPAIIDSIQQLLSDYGVRDSRNRYTHSV